MQEEGNRQECSVLSWALLEVVWHSTLAAGACLAQNPAVLDAHEVQRWHRSHRGFFKCKHQ